MPKQIVSESKLVEEYRQTLKRAFTGPDKADYIHMDGRSAMNEYLSGSWNYYIDEGYIKVKTNESDEQDTFMEGRITPKGKNWIIS